MWRALAGFGEGGDGKRAAARGWRGEFSGRLLIVGRAPGIEALEQYVAWAAGIESR